MKLCKNGDFIEIGTDLLSTEYFSDKLEIILGVIFVHKNINFSNKDVETFLRKYLSEDKMVDLMMEVDL